MNASAILLAALVCISIVMSGIEGTGLWDDAWVRVPLFLAGLLVMVGALMAEGRNQ